MDGVLFTLDALASLILTIALEDIDIIPMVTDEQTEAQTGKVTCPK